VAIFALPSGILGAGLALTVQEEEKSRQMKKKEIPAAILIQTAWRCYCANGTSSVATWARHRNPPSSLTKSEKTAIQFLRNIQFVIAKRTFKTLMSPVDLQDVMEQFENSRYHLLGKMKNLQSGLDKIKKRLEKDNRLNNECLTFPSTSSPHNDERTLEEMMVRMNEKLDNQTQLLNMILNNHLNESLNNQGSLNSRRVSF